MPPRPTVADDDVDDLDDVLDEFSRPPPAPKPQPPLAAASAASSSQPPIIPPPEELDEDFVRELAAGMESLMRDLIANDPDAQTATDWDNALKELQDPTAGGSAPTQPSEIGTSAAADASFQASLRATLEKLKESDASLKADEADAVSNDQLAQLQELLAGLAGEGGDDAAGEGADDQIPGVLQNLMQSLMSKEILYEPLKDLSSKYPEYIASHKDSLPPADLERFTEQSELVARIVAIFETPDYSDDDAVKSSEVLTLMNEMQSKGSPPTEIMGELPPGMEMGPDGMPKLPDSCTIC